MSSDLERIPSANPSIPTVIEDVSNAFYTGQALQDLSREIAQGMLRDFANKSLVINMMTLAHLQARNPRTMRALMSIEDYMYAPDYLMGVAADPDQAREYYKLFLESIFKTVDLSTKFAQVVSTALDKGMDPEKHLHVHVHSPLDEIQHPGEVMERPEIRKRITDIYNVVEALIEEKSSAPPPRNTIPSRLVPGEHAHPPGGRITPRKEPE